jgi:hypothetical protein
MFNIAGIKCKFVEIYYKLNQIRKHTSRQVSRSTNRGTVVPNICGLTLWNLLYVTPLASVTLKWLQENLSTAGLSYVRGCGGQEADAE